MKVLVAIVVALVLRSALADRYDLWAVDSRGMLALSDDQIPFPRWAGQVWLREHALLDL